MLMIIIAVLTLFLVAACAVDFHREGVRRVRRNR